MSTHFADDARPGSTLCGQPWSGVVWGNDPKPSCEPCCDEHARRTNWSFPLPEKVD